MYCNCCSFRYFKRIYCKTGRAIQTEKARMTEKLNLKLPGLNGLRAISILLVICCHLEGQYALFPFLPKYFPLILDGQFGVNVFFVISGFLITTLLLNEEKLSGTVS